MKSFFRGIRCLTSNKPFDFGAGPEHDLDRRIFKPLYATAAQGQNQCKNFAISAALAPRVHVVTDISFLSGP